MAWQDDLCDDDAGFDYYSDDYDGGDVGDALEELEESDRDFKRREKNYTILAESDIHRQIDDAVTELSGVLSLSKHEASTLLRHYNWSPSKVHDAWFTDESTVRNKLGLPADVNRSSSEAGVCAICFESYSPDSIKSAACGHPFCRECWGLYINTNINDGPGSLTLRCPEPSCRVAVSEDMLNELASDEDKKKYNRFLARSYVEDNRKRKWCPAPGCDRAIDFAGADGNFDVSCFCSHIFCWNCSEEKHRPVECAIVAKWNLKNNSDSQNEEWKKAYTKPCPKCGRSIEKNDGCMHMTCGAPCKFHFCWVCLQDWSVHGYAGSCNRFRENPDINFNIPLKQELLKYQHYYERWAANEKSKQIAMGDLKKVEDELLEKTARAQGEAEAQLSFITEAWQQIIECRRVLKWTYAYGYYLPENEFAKTELFEYLQGQAESSLERLHDCAEKELKDYANDESKSIGFWDFRRKLLQLTKASENYFENLVTALESGLSDVTCHGSEKGSSSKNYSIMKAGKYEPSKRSRVTNVAVPR